MNAKKTASDPTKTVLIISIGFLLVYVITKQAWAIKVSLIVGLLGLISSYLASKIDFVWMKLAWVLSMIVPNILLSLIFFLILFPIGLLSRLFGEKDPLKLKRQNSSLFRNSEKTFSKESFEKPW